MAHNRRVFPQAKNSSARFPVVLFELNMARSANIAYSYLANVLAEEHQARIVAYAPLPMSGWVSHMIFYARLLLSLEPFGTYKSFGTTGFFCIAPSEPQRTKALHLFNQCVPKLQSKRDVEALSIDGVRIGDLIYDSYMMRLLRPTIDINGAEFQKFLLQSLETFVFWQDYFQTHDVRAVNVSHCVYNLAMPLRLAVHRNIPAYQANITHVYRLSAANLFAYNDFFYFRERFAGLPPDVRSAGLSEAKRRIERRFSGEIGVDMSYSKKTAYGRNRHAKLLEKSDRKKILIASHCFFDSPHSYGDNVFPDFYEWLDFLGKISEETDYDWYIKTHPDYLPGTKEIIDGFVIRYPRFHLLPSDASHHQIISEGIDLALTVFGTIAFEYAALGIPVICASQVNPHIAYSFNWHAKDVADYRQLLISFSDSSLSINESEIHEYYFMRFIFNTENLFFIDYEKAINDLGGYYGQFEAAVYDRWSVNWSLKHHDFITTALQTFIRSDDFRMDYRHFGKEFTVESIERRT